MMNTFPGEMAICPQPCDLPPCRIKNECQRKHPVDAKDTEPAHSGALSAGGPIRGAAFLGVKKLRGRNIILVAACHNRRTIEAEVGASDSIDPTRSCLNETLAGPSSAKGVDLLAQKLMAAAEVKKLRKDAVLGIEVVFSLPPGHNIDDKAYFIDCLTWVYAYFGGAQNVLSADIHRDEAAPHCHVLILPLVQGRMNGSNLIGGKEKLKNMQMDFHQKVAVRFGFSKAPARLSGFAKQAASQAVVRELRNTGDKALESVAWPVIRVQIENDPRPFALRLGIEVVAPKKKLKTMAAIFTSAGKGAPNESSL